MRSIPPLHRAAVAVLKFLRRVAVRSHLHELWVGARASWRRAVRRDPWPETRFVIFGQGRSGSSLLVGLIGSHPAIHCEKEIFHWRVAGRLFSPSRYVSARAILSPKSVYGCKLKIYQITEDQGIDDPRQFLLDLHAADWKFVYLFRQDLFRKALSLVVARARGKFTVSTGETGPRMGPVRIDPVELIAAMRQRNAHGQREVAALGEIPHITVTYEEDLLRPEAHQMTSDRVFEFLGLPSVPVGAELVRTSRDRISDYIENYDELVAAVRQTELASHVPE